MDSAELTLDLIRRLSVFTEADGAERLREAAEDLEVLLAHDGDAEGLLIALAARDQRSSTGQRANSV